MHTLISRPHSQYLVMRSLLGGYNLVIHTFKRPVYNNNKDCIKFLHKEKAARGSSGPSLLLLLQISPALERLAVVFLVPFLGVDALVKPDFRDLGRKSFADEVVQSQRIEIAIA